MNLPDQALPWNWNSFGRFPQVKSVNLQLESNQFRAEMERKNHKVGTMHVHE
jgi:hypothetical protein